ncbi:MAG: hypothetical protein KDD82_26585, partial [Planctomycetes bacterium]|nr:hypothetical protein [Planctomycetota bacterium]
MPRLRPRHVYALVALSLLSGVAWVDRDLLALPDYLRLQGSPARAAPIQSSPPLPQEIEAVQSLRRALEDCAEARARYAQRVGAGSMLPVDEGLLAVLEQTPRAPAAAAYHQARAHAWPEYAQALHSAIQRALAASARDPQNGLYEVTAGLLELELAVTPCSADPLAGAVGWAELSSITRVTDPVALRRATSHLRRGLSRPSFGTHHAEHSARLAASADGTPLRRLTRRLVACGSIELPEAFAVLDSGRTLLRLAESTPPARRTPLLELGRRLGLRMATESQTTLGLMIGAFLVSETDGLWDPELGPASVAAARERERLDALSARRTPPVSRDTPLGALDRVTVREGVWTAAYDPALNRDLDRALLRSLALWGLLVLAGAWLVAGAGAGRGPSAGCGARFTLGEALLVVGP